MAAYGVGATSDRRLRLRDARRLFGYSTDIERDRIELRAAAERALAVDDPYAHYAMFLPHACRTVPRRRSPRRSG